MQCFIIGITRDLDISKKRVLGGVIFSCARVSMELSVGEHELADASGAVPILSLAEKKRRRVHRGTVPGLKISDQTISFNISVLNYFDHL